MSPRDMNRLAGAVAALGLLAGWPTELQADPVLHGTHYYEFVEVADPFTGENNAWWTARDGAASRSWLGLQGHLATVTSQAENDFLYSLVAGQYAGFTGAWLGCEAPEGWLVGPEAGQGFSYQAWGGIEPNNDGYAYMNVGTDFAGIGAGRWADDSGANGIPQAGVDPVIGYFVEYDGAGTAVPPPPATTLGGVKAQLGAPR